MHKHHIIPKHCGGTDDPSNLIEVTVEEHAQIHHNLWMLEGREQDKIAWLALSKQIGKEEARIAACKAVVSQPEVREKCRQSALKRLKEGTHNLIGLNEKRVVDGTHNFLDGEKNRQTQLKRVEDGTHNFLSGEIQRRDNKNRLENGTHPSIPIYTCPHCGKVGKGFGMFRWHFDNCETNVGLQK